MEQHRDIKNKLVKILKAKAGELVRSNVKEGECYTLPNTGIYLSKRTGIANLSEPPYSQVYYCYDLFYNDFYAMPDVEYEEIILLMNDQKLKKIDIKLDAILKAIS